MINHPIIDKLSHIKNGVIGDGVYISYEMALTDDDTYKRLCRVYLGTKKSGPILQYDAGDCKFWDGLSTRCFKDGAWTPIYSRGNFGCNYAHGGNWSGHSLNLHDDIAIYCRKPEDSKCPAVILGDTVFSVPEGVKADVTIHDIDCSVSWGIWFPSARDAMRGRLTRDQIVKSTLPSITRAHLIHTESTQTIEAVNEVIDTYNL